MKLYRYALARKIKLFFVFGMILMACNRNKVPDNVVPKDKIVNVLVDMHLADAVLSRVSNQDTMLMMASSKYYFIFKKYGIDSAKFTRSLKYYNYQPDEFAKLYAQVVDSLNAKIPKEKIIKKKKTVLKE
jgi:hypothetical protein